jgi:Ca-activated chloride channel family protein
MAQTALNWLEAGFAQPWLLLMLGTVPLLLLSRWLYRYRRLVGMVLLAGGHRLAAVNARRRRWLNVGLFVALILLIVGSAGPRWGRDPRAPTALGRDILVVLDISRSMLAEDRPPRSRLLRAQDQLFELADVLQRRGGYRIGLIGFAGQARVLCQLTDDYDAFRFAVAEARPELLGVGERIGYKEDGTSFGTSLRRALELAAQTHDPRFRGFQEVLLISDGDDLAGDWWFGIQAAQQAALPVHGFAVGDPARESFIPTGRSDVPYQLHEGQRVRTRRNDAALLELSRQTGGTFVAEEDGGQALVRWFRTRVATQPVREWTEDQRSLALLRYGWFLLAALILLVGEMVLGDWHRVEH